MFSGSETDISRSTIDNCGRIIYDSEVMLQFVVSFTNIIYDHHFLIEQPAGYKKFLQRVHALTELKSKYLLTEPLLKIIDDCRIN